MPNIFKLIVLGLLELYRGLTVLSFSASQGLVATNACSILGKKIKARFIYSYGGVRSYVMDHSPGSSGWILRFQENRLYFYIFQSNGSTATINTSSTSFVEGVEYDIEALAIGTTLSITVNGVVDTGSFDGTYKVPVTGAPVVGNTVELGSEPLASLLLEASIEDCFAYNLNGQFENTTVLDSSGLNNNGTVTSLDMWNKTDYSGKSVDQNEENQAAFQSTIPATPDTNIHYDVVDIQTGAEPDTDASWGLYANSPYLTVRKQISLAIKYFILMQILSGDDEMAIPKNHREVDVSSNVDINHNESIFIGTGGTIVVEDADGVEATYQVEGGLPMRGYFKKIIAAGTSVSGVVLQR